ncbi:MAG: hypothetical protein J7M14_08130, partial [Planctomycetes bacterium]|nr:hypothetical protein [Planctomycetota bacterium]
MKRWIILAICVAAAQAAAVSPAEWRHSSEQEFAEGEFTKTVVNSRGEVSLAREVTVLMPSQDAPEIISAVVASGEAIYAGAGSSNDIYRIADGKATKFASPAGTIITSLAWGKRGLLAGTGGRGAGLYCIDATGKVEKLWSDPDVQYVWAIVEAGDILFAATGPKCAVYRIQDGSGKIIYQAEKLAKNVLSLAMDAEGMLYAGTDDKGLVVRIHPTGKWARVVLDAAEKEIAAIVIGDAGGVYVATSEASKANATGKISLANGKPGKAVIPAGKPRATTRPASETLAIKAAPATRPDGAAARTKADKGDEPAKRAQQHGSAESTATGSTVAHSATTQPTTRATAAATTRAATPKQAAAAPKKPSPRPPSAPAQRLSASTSTGKGAGNAVYYIQTDGLVRTLFRKPLTVMAMKMYAGSLLLGTGNGGAIYSVSLDGDVVAKLADTDAKLVTSLAITPEEQAVFATANKGSVAMLAGKCAGQGMFVSKVLDAGQIAHWGAVEVRTSSGAEATIATRSGNLAKADDETWSAWSDEQLVGAAPLRITSPAARFLQYRLTLTFTEGASPVVHEVALIYQIGNLAPTISAVTVTASAQKASPPRGRSSGAKVYRMVAIKAADPNKDKLRYKIEFRRLGGRNWIQIAEKLAKPSFAWDTRTPTVRASHATLGLARLSAICVQFRPPSPRNS